MVLELKEESQQLSQLLQFLNFSEKALSLLFQWCRENEELSITTCCSSLFWHSHGQFFHYVFYFAIAKLQQITHTTENLSLQSIAFTFFCLVNERETKTHKDFRYRCDFSDVLHHLLDSLLSMSI